MNVDAQTLKDLQIVGTHSTTASCVMQLIDRTRTSVGRQALRAKLVAPSADRGEIESAQRAHSFLADDAPALHPFLEPTICDGAERYLTNSWPLPEQAGGLSRVIDSYAVPRSRDYWVDVQTGQFRLSALVRAACELRERLAAGPPVLCEIASRLSDLLSPQLVENVLALGERTSKTERLQFDAYARGPVRGELTAILQAMGAVDAMLSIGIASRELGWSYPTFSDRLQIRGLWHPLVRGTGVRNDFAMGEPVRVCFVSGPNMSGKTTLLKAVGIAVLLAQIGSGVPASAMSFEPFEALLSSIDINDNLARGESFYMAEVRRLGYLANLVRAHPKTLALVDEPFRGTNTEDAIEGTREIVSALLSLPRALVVVASHLSQVMRAFEGHAGIQALHFAASVRDGEIAFDYEARPGVSTQRLGMMLLRKENVLELLEAAGAASRDI